MSYAVGSLVKARGREWVVLPESQDDLLLVRPLGGTDDEATGICPSLETIEPARFDLPDVRSLGDWRSCRLLRDAVRLGFRASAGPFRSFAKLAVEPRPYQLVPLLVGLRQDPVRLLVADDVGIGKTIEACLLARELLDRGEINRIAVLCPPHLAEQWQRELRDKFHIHAELVLPSTTTKLERRTPPDRSIFECFPFVIVSLDFIKSDRRRDEFLRTCPELVIIDEAHTCAYAAAGRGGRHQRHQLLKALSQAPDRHIILVTATPHSGNEDAFRSLLGLLDDDLASLPEDLSGQENERYRRQLAQYFVQRRRGDIRHYMQADTPFPDRQEKEETYTLSKAYAHLFTRVLSYARETVQDESGGRQRQRVRWWSALALLRALASSPAAAAATLRNRAATAEAETPEEADEIGQRTVLDLINEEPDEGMDVTPGVQEADDQEQQEQTRTRRRLLDLAKEAKKLCGREDNKVLQAADLVKGLVSDGYNPIVFCRFIDTAQYVADELRSRLPKKVEIAAVTGLLPPAEREQRVADLARADKRVLVCTDCLSEGINLQENFNAVLHYDLSWNPTRHEQRDGRVDRYGQASPTVRVLTYYSIDNQIDGIVLDVLIRKHKSIRTSLGISVPVPVDSEKVLEAIFEGLLLRGKGDFDDQQLKLFDAEVLEPARKEVHTDWENMADREKRSRTMFAQEAIKVDEVAAELDEVRSAIGSGVDVERFMHESLHAYGAVVSPKQDGLIHVDLKGVPEPLADALSVAGLSNHAFDARFQMPVHADTLYLTRTHPIVEKTAAHVMDTALDPLIDGVARRCGAIRTGKAARRTTLLLLRLRYQIISAQGEQRPLLAEDCRVIGYTGSPASAQWLEPGTVEELLAAAPDANVNPDQARDFVQEAIDGLPALADHLDRFAEQRGQEILAAHERVRQAARGRGKARVEAKLPPDVLGVYVYLPVPKL